MYGVKSFIGNMGLTILLLIVLWMSLCNISTAKKIFSKLSCVALIFLMVGTLMVNYGLPMTLDSNILYIFLFFAFMLSFSYSFANHKSIIDQILSAIILLIGIVVFYTAAINLQMQAKNTFNFHIYVFSYIQFLLSLFFTSRLRNGWCKLLGITIMYMATSIFIILYFSVYAKENTSYIITIYDTLYYCFNLEKEINNDMKLIRLTQYISFGMLNTITIALIMGLAFELWHPDSSSKQS